MEITLRLLFDLTILYWLLGRTRTATNAYFFHRMLSFSFNHCEINKFFSLLPIVQGTRRFTSSKHKPSNMHFGGEIMSSMLCSYYGYHPTASLHARLKETTQKINVHLKTKGES